ncbi:MAG: formylglycine-generating enzyme family protein [Symploca sp. SIO1B1]|nr:formylglycine-generating enzyme family protein [Symploca sp. SIO1C2]NER96378.1 formylglycine-generating enzyme family protein [Symploca sp. SIO1B1]
MDPETLGIAQLNSLLKQAELDLDAQQIADILWLAVQIREIEETSPKETAVRSTFGEGFQSTSSNFVDNIDAIPLQDHQTAINTETKTPPDAPLTPPIKTTSNPPAASAYLPDSPENQLPKKIPKKTVSEGIPFQAPAAPALRQPLALARALRPLMRKVPSPTQTVIDEEETVTQISEKGIWTPVLKPAPERWLELALVVEESGSTVIWQEIIAEFQRLTELQGAFRDVRTWGLKTDHNGVIKLIPKGNFSAKKQRSRSFKELLDPTGRRLILLISDCISPIWRQGKVYQILKHWSNHGPVAILQLLPERIWGRTALGAGFPIQLSSLVPGVANSQLVVEGLPVWEEVNLANAVNLPVITLEPDSLKQWSRVVAGAGNTQTTGILWDLSLLPQASAATQEQLSAVDLVKRFRTTASPIARRLAGLMAAVPVSLPVVYLIQETLLPESRQVHVAEVFMSGLLQPQSDVGGVGAKHLGDNLSQKPKVYNPNASPSDSWETNPGSDQIVQYEFVEGVRNLLVDSVPIPDVDAVLEKVSQYIARRAGLSMNNFAALLSPHAKWDKATEKEVMPFARIATQVLHRLGGEYAALAEQLEGQSSDTSTPEIKLEPFDFDVATIELEATKLTIHRRQQQAHCFTEDLGNGIELEMIAIPSGSFLMGSPKDEPERRSSESPQHRVTVKSFLMGKYAITQAQWQVVAALPPVKTKLQANLSRFQGEDRPVEGVSWYDAVEFCDRLSLKTGRQYRLPSEAEWEYACRAGTTTPFHFGETITTNLAHYDDNYIYGSGSQGKYRGKTTPVGSFKVANDFGLYDMHGNVWEWCADHWHNNYEGAPKDSNAWVDRGDHENLCRLLRGGSWFDYPKVCRSASRLNYVPSYSHVDLIGFRVVCEAAWTL